jgi:hypothetical protein
MAACFFKLQHWVYKDRLKCLHTLDSDTAYLMTGSLRWMILNASEMTGRLCMTRRKQSTKNLFTAAEENHNRYQRWYLISRSQFQSDIPGIKVTFYIDCYKLLCFHFRKVKVKIILLLIQAPRHDNVWGNGGITHEVSTGTSWVLSYTLRPLYPGSRSRRCGDEKNRFRCRKFTPVFKYVAKSLRWLSYPTHKQIRFIYIKLLACYTYALNSSPARSIEEALVLKLQIKNTVLIFQY